MKQFLYLILIFFSSGALLALPVTNGLLAYYNFNGNFTDSSGNNYNATSSNGASIGTGMYGGGLLLNGSSSDAYVSGIPLNTTAGGYNTFAFWMKWGGGNYEMPIGFYNYDLEISSSWVGFNSGQNDITGISTSGLANQWVHVVAEFYNGVPSPSNNVLYINGVKQTLSTIQGTPVYNPPSNYFYMGAWGASGGYNFGGTLDEVMVFNRALTGAEVSQVYGYNPAPEPSSILLVFLPWVFAFFYSRRK